MTHTCDVAIVGGGIGGLTLAASLAQQSISVQVFEQDNQLREIGAGIAIGGNATRLLHRLGVDLSRVANVPPALEFRRWKDGRLLWSHPIGEWYRHEVGAALLMLHRATLQRFLAAAVPSDCIRLSRRLADLSDESAGVRLHFADGEDVVARVVAGADGVNSTVRRYVCGDVKPAHSGEIGFRGVIPVGKSRDLPDPTALNIWCGPGTHVVCYGLDRGELVNLLAVYKPHRLPAWTRSSNRLPATSDQALAIFTEYRWDPRILDLIRKIEGDMSFWALVDLPRLPRWSRGRVVLLGDAAHAPLPHQGQGAGLAIEDAYALGALLGRGGLDDHGSAFEAFEHLRKRRTALVQAYSRASGRAVKLAGDAAARRDASWPSLPQRIGWIHRYREEEMLSSPSRFGASAPAGRAVLRCGDGRAVRQARRPGTAGGAAARRRAGWRAALASAAAVTTMTEQAREVQGGGTWGPREAAAEWRRGAAARLQAFGPATEMMLDLVQVAEGSRVLDVGAGAGDSTVVAAQRVGSTGRVLATDVSASMLEVAAELARQAGLNNVDTRVVDAQRLDLAPASFDAAVSRNCLMLIPDYRQALTSIRRVLKPGGRLAAIVFSAPDRCPYLSLPHAIVFRMGRFTSPAPERFGEFRLGAPGVLEDAFGTAGFREISVRAVPARRRFPSLGEAMQYARGPLPLRELMARLSRAEQEQAWAEIERALAQFAGPQGYDSPCELLIGVGTK